MEYMEEVVEDEFQCTLCFEVFFYPVTLPCKHRFCKACFDKHVDNNRFSCPLCRARLSNWLRKLHLNNENIVDSEFWEIVQKKYPRQVESRRNGDVKAQLLPMATKTGELLSYVLNVNITDDLKKETIENLHMEMENSMAHDWSGEWRGWPSVLMTQCRDVLVQVTQQAVATKELNPYRNGETKMDLAEPGEIRKEFEEFLLKLHEEDKRQDEKNFRLSKELIKKIEEEERWEEEKRQMQLRADEELARSLRREQETSRLSMLSEQNPQDSSSVQEPLKGPSTPKRKKQRKSKLIEVDESSSGCQDSTISTITIDDSSGCTDASTSSPFKNSDEMNHELFGDSPVFLGPYSPSFIAQSSSSTSNILHTSTPRRKASSTIKSTNISPICLDKPSTSKDNIFAKYFAATSGNQNSKGQSSQQNFSRKEPPNSMNLAEALSKPSTSTAISNQQLSHFTTVLPAPFTSDSEPLEKQMSMSRCSSGADSIGQELRHFKPIRSSPTTPPKEGSSSWLPQMVVAQKGGLVTVPEQLTDHVPVDLVMALCAESGGDLSPEDLEESIKLENQLEADRRLALELQKQWQVEDRKKPRDSIPLVRTDYNLRNRRKGSLRKKVLIDRAQATLDSMLIK